MTDGMNVTGYKILSQSWLASDKVQVELQVMAVGGFGMSVPLVLQNIDGEWKLVAFTRRDAEGKVSGLEFVKNPPFQ